MSDAQKGEALTCRAGHVMAHANRFIAHGEIDTWGDALDFVDRARPKQGDPWPTCATCGEPLNAGGYYGGL